MHFYIMTLFPEMVMQGLNTSIIGRAMEKGILSVDAVNIRDYAFNKHNSVDDYPYGGGAGMLMQAEPVYQAYLAVEEKIAAARGEREEAGGITENREDPEKAGGITEIQEDSEEAGGITEIQEDLEEAGGITEIQEDSEEAGGITEIREEAGKRGRTRVIYLSPQGRTFNQKMAEEFAEEEELVFLCGHYEGIDERVLEEIVTDYVSIGDYILTGGELPAMIMVDAISRLVPGVLHNDVSAEFESFQDNLLEYPQYSRPEIWHDKRVPEILLSGHHANIEKWRREQSVLRTARLRPDLLEKAELTEAERDVVRGQTV